MKYISFLTEKVKADAKRHGYTEDVEKLALRIETEQTDEMFQPYEPTNYRKKRMGSYRLACYEKIIDNFAVYCFLRVFVRGEKDYEKFYDNPNVLNEYIPSDVELKNVIKQKEHIPIFKKPDLRENESNFLFSTSDDIFSNNIIILESEEWVELISSKEFEDYRLHFLKPIHQIINNTENCKDVNLMISDENPNVKILFRYFEKQKHLFLIAPVIQTNSDKLEKYKKTYKVIIDKDYEFNREEILKMSVKAYPDLITIEDDLWLRIQKSNEGNLALSPEEEEIVRHINFDTGDKPKYPLFINGRAGSGKSTILIYLFTDILTRYIKCNLKKLEDLNPPVFITYSDILLKNVKGYAKKLFESNANKIADEEVKLSDNELNKILEKSFKKFEDHILELIGKESEIKYKKEKYIDFYKFKKFFLGYIQQNPDHTIRKLSPEICWHIIRTYIKGMRDKENNYLDAEAYSELPKNFKTVQLETYKLVYDKIWKNWYDADYIGHGFWDSQDITRTLLDMENDLAIYPGIFCDEAQDFTRIELELIFKLCLFSNRELESNNLKFIPFAFAGDPFQTLNPTGFDWNSIKANFHEKIVKPFDKFGRANLEFNFNELSFNYRSSKGIVQFSNLIQLLRGVLFKIKDLNPQKSWLKSDDILPEFYKISDEKIYNILKEESAKGIVFIIPVQEGGDLDYIKGDNLLSNIADVNKDFTGNLLTPLMAKGLEFSRVVVYRFGQEYLDRDNFNFLDRINEEITNPEEYLPYQYFINNLYVACSRAKKRLFIVDTEDGINNFWCKLKDMREDLLLKYEYLTGNSNWVEDSICEIMEGTEIDNIKKDPDNPLDLAEQFYHQGVANKDIDLLKRARQNFKLGGNEQKAKSCNALIFEFEKDFKKAAERYLELGEKNSAIRCYWEGAEYEKLISISNETDPRNIASRFLVKKVDANALLNFMIDSLQVKEFETTFLDKYFVDDKWFDIFNLVVEDLSKNHSLDPNINLAICKKLNRLFEFDKRLSMTNEFAILLFASNEHQKAIDIWDTLGINNHENYFLAKVNVTDYPDKIEWQYKLKQFDEILSFYKNSGKDINSFNNIQKDIIINILTLRDPESMKEVLESIVNHSELKINKETVNKLLEELLKKNLYPLYYKLYSANSNDESIKSNFDEIRQGKVESFKDLVSVISFIDLNLRNNYLYPALNATTFHIFGNKLITDSGKLELYKMIINAIQRQKFDPNDTDFRQLQVKIVDWVNYLKKDLFTSNSIGIEALGACLERSGYIVPTFEFYESIIRDTGNGKYSEKQRDFAKERWVKTKDRQGESLNNPVHKDKAEEMFRAYQLNKKFKRISEILEYPLIEDFKIDTDKIFVINEGNISDNDLHSQVILSKPDVVEKYEDPVLKTFQVNDKHQNVLHKFNELFEVTIRNDEILKIRNKISNDTSILNLKRKSMISEVEDKRYNNNNCTIWELKDWKIWIILEKSKVKSIKISFDNKDNIVFEHIY